MVNNKKMCTHFFRSTAARVCACGLTPLERDGAMRRATKEAPHSNFLSSRRRCWRPCDFFPFYVLVYPSLGVVHFFYYRSEFQSRFCRDALEAAERVFCIAFLSSTRSAGPALLSTLVGGWHFVLAHVLRCPHDRATAGRCTRETP